MTDLSDSDDGDGDSGSDFELSDADAAAVEESEEVSWELSFKVLIVDDYHIFCNNCRKRNSLTTSSKSLAMMHRSAEGEGEAPIWNQRGDPAGAERYFNHFPALLTYPL